MWVVTFIYFCSIVRNSFGGAGVSVVSYDRLLDRFFFEDRFLVKKFIAHLVSEGRSESTILTYVRILSYVSRFLRKSLREIGYEDILFFLYKRKDYSECRKMNVKQAFKVFWKYMGRLEDYNKLKLRVVETETPPPLTREELEKLESAATRLYEKLIVKLLYETGARNKEFRTIKLKNIKFDSKGAAITVSGKTGQRTIRVIESAQLLKTYLELHPMKHPEAYLFYKGLGAHRGTNYFKPISETGLRQIIRRLKKKAGIKRRIFPHLFRHTRATHLASKLPEKVLMKFFGWKTRIMVDRYAHLTTEDIDEALIEFYEREKQLSQIIRETEIQANGGISKEEIKKLILEILSEIVIGKIKT